jgi:hypothetical protein
MNRSSFLGIGCGLMLGIGIAAYTRASKYISQKAVSSSNTRLKKPRLYIYDHCPYCVRARMIFGLKGLSVDLVFLANHDEDTPINLVGSKVVPILETNRYVLRLGIGKGRF